MGFPNRETSVQKGKEDSLIRQVICMRTVGCQVNETCSPPTYLIKGEKIHSSEIFGPKQRFWTRLEINLS